MFKEIKESPVLLLISGPAGCGKTTLCDQLTDLFKHEIQRAVTCTTRPPRGTEQNGIDYFFLSHDEFDAGVKNGEFLEYAKVHSNFYGVRNREIENILNSGKNVLLNLDVQGAQTVRKVAEKNEKLQKSLTTVFIMPPSMEELYARLNGRKTDSDDEIARRMKIAEDEMKCWKDYDYCLVSADRKSDFNRIVAIYQTQKMRIVK